MPPDKSREEGHFQCADQYEIQRTLNWSQTKLTEINSWLNALHSSGEGKKKKKEKSCLCFSHTFHLYIHNVAPELRRFSSVSSGFIPFHHSPAPIRRRPKIKWAWVVGRLCQPFPPTPFSHHHNIKATQPINYSPKREQQSIAPHPPDPPAHYHNPV